MTSQCNVARDWVRYAPFCFCCDSRGRTWGPQHHRFITGPPTPPTKRQNGGLLSCIARWYISSECTFVKNVRLRHNALFALRHHLVYPHVLIARGDTWRPFSGFKKAAMFPVQLYIGQWFVHNLAVTPPFGLWLYCCCAPSGGVSAKTRAE